ncbi:insulinase family protein [Paenibacillus sp. N1-5-1-14]|uniref:EF-P 5-aminopentanol modification-associated protein YfmH n=1 Tax=Paenibacillus radicibacter TaxID=2972488 RepID=UPI002158FF9C|nr:pitrilysin family protein [Paenibacillus radicibacter]MCR8642126.1 insulinase family protein [Paenibacillus radicibacter]
MRSIPYPHLDETLYTKQLDNGLRVYILPKAGFQKTYATFTTQYGSVDNHFAVGEDTPIQVPDGIAHFLEHKMFEEPEGDVFNKFASLGASANAFTSFDRTSYLFTATDNVLDNLGTLLDFVQSPYWTEESVEKEKGIIGQEIKMYQDNPDWRSYFGLIEAMYKVHPIHIDIAGTIESISKITKDTLFNCYYTFYHPSNMVLFVVGGIDVNEVMEFVEQNQAKKTFKPQGEIKHFFDPEPDQVHTPKKVIKLPVSLPKCLIGFKEVPLNQEGTPLLKRELTTKLLLDVLFSGSSPIYQSLYDENLISDSFGHEYNITADYSFSVFGGETRDPDLLISKIKDAVTAVQKQGISEQSFERSRKKKIGSFLRMMNSPEAIAGEFTKYLFNGIDMFEILSVYENMKLEDVMKRFNEHFEWERLAISIVRSD